MPVNKQDRSKQPLRAGGNSPDKGIEKHNSSKGEQVAMYPINDKGDRAPGKKFKEGGQSVKSESQEKHGQKKDLGKKYIGGKLVGEAPVIPAEVQVSERRHGAGNDPNGGHEHQMCHGGSERVSAKVNRS